MKVAIIARSTLYNVAGGDTVQALQTAKHLIALGVDAEVILSHQNIDYSQYDLLHFFNLIRPADILYHSKKAGLPYVVSTILVDYSEYDKFYRTGAGKLLAYLPANSIEYVKTMARWLLGRDKLTTKAYIWRGQYQCIKAILNRADMILPNSLSEYRRVMDAYPSAVKFKAIPNGIDPDIFKPDVNVARDEKLVLCVARIEGIKNQINLIKALNNTEFKLVLIGNYSPNQKTYYNHCRAIAAANVEFINHLPQQQLLAYYQTAAVHVLPSWFETTGLSSLEAAATGCNIVITDKGDTREYFAADAFYCDPARPESILQAIMRAVKAGDNIHLRDRILKKYTWHQAAKDTFDAYQQIITQHETKHCHIRHPGHT